MKLPRVNPVGLVELPEDYPASPRRYTTGRRWLVLAVVALFALTTLVTGAVSLGRYCLTTDGGDTRELERSAPSRTGRSNS